MGGLPGEVQHLQEEGGELETYCFASGKKGLQWDITNSPRGNGRQPCHYWWSSSRKTFRSTATVTG